MYCTLQATVHKARIQEIAVYALNGAIWEKPPYAQVMYHKYKQTNATFQFKKIIFSYKHIAVLLLLGDSCFVDFVGTIQIRTNIFNNSLNTT